MTAQRSLDAAREELGATAVRDASAAPYVGSRSVGHGMGALAIDPFNSGRVLYGTGCPWWW